MPQGAALPARTPSAGTPLRRAAVAIALAAAALSGACSRDAEPQAPARIGSDTAKASGVPRAEATGDAKAAATEAPPGQAGAAEGNGQASSLTVSAATPRSVALRRTLPATGTITAWQEIAISPEVGGYLVASVNADVGTQVRKGQVLATLRSDLLAADLAQRRAAREQARASLANAQSVLRRAEPLKEPGAISDEELDRLRTDVLTARARLQSTEAELSTAQLRLDKARIVSPDAGTITSRSTTVGRVAQPGEEMFRLLRQGRLEWRAEVPELRLREIRPGQQVALRTADGSRLTGRVRTVAPTVQSDSRSALVYVDIVAGSGARPGQFARGEFDLGRSEALTVPLAALVVQDGMNYVFVVGPDGRVERRRIEIGATQGSTVEVSQGLRADERVVAQGAGYLRDGDRVTVAAAPAADAAADGATAGSGPAAAAGATPPAGATAATGATGATGAASASTGAAEAAASAGSAR